MRGMGWTKVLVIALMHGTCLQIGTALTEIVTIEAVVITENGRRAVIAIGEGVLE